MLTVATRTWSKQVLAQFVHRIDPVLLAIGPLRLWWYGAAYAIGFLGIHQWALHRRRSLDLSAARCDDLAITFALCVLVFGRAFEILVYELDYFVRHPEQLLSYWRGGMASHGVVLGGAAAIAVFARFSLRSFFRLADELVIPAALFLALGRVGNFINGQIVGSVTDAWCGVRFPGMDEFRHPVTLYDAAKNLAMIPILLIVRRWAPPGRGVMLAVFLIGYGALRIIVDLFRDYPDTPLGVGTGQWWNAATAVFGLMLLVRQVCTPRHAVQEVQTPASRNGDGGPPRNPRRWPRLALFGAILLFSLTIRSGWSQDVLAELRRGRRPDDARAVSEANRPAVLPMLRCSERMVRSISDRFAAPHRPPAYARDDVRAGMADRVQRALAELACCCACPRDCRIDRLANETRVCRTGRLARVASAFAHFGEEDCLRGWNGSGTIFFSMCNLRCVFCQNWDISQRAAGQEMNAGEIADLMLALQERGCHNVNFVTPEHVAPQVVEAIAAAVERGLSVPIVYNTSGYDALSSLRLLDGLVDIYMPDFKFWSSETAKRLAKAKDYPDRAREAIREMHRQVGPLCFTPDGLASRGVLVRHLVMPGLLNESAAIFRWLAEELSPDTYVNIMSQYRPAYEVGRIADTGRDAGQPRYADIDRSCHRDELQAAYAAARAAGLWRFDERRETY